MAGSDAFLDSNVLLYLLSSDAAKADRAEAILRSGATVSVQVLNEVTNVARRKLALSWAEIDELLALVEAFVAVEPLTVETNRLGRTLAQRHQLALYDAMIAASALIAECRTLYSEDMHSGLVIDDTLRIVNPF
ncbi:PIN domain-containing protein [Ramlibacter sp.]|uniref:PIN domain-containing protein n=1 Tax=Ramlibacter sp. TaxID=1917967 RepID=UPI003D113026